MAVDHYAPCPCGSGKKLKFCKCVDQPQDYEKIVKLIEGGQGLAAVDRINQLLAKTPNTAWLLALKGELTLTMGETDSFKETASRFLRLKPDNPLALVMKSIVASLEQEPVENAARYLLDGMSEAREALPAMTLLAIRLLINSLMSTGRVCLVGYWGQLLVSLSTGNEENEDERVHLDPNINLLAKVQTNPLPDAPGAQWKERLAEVVSLAGAFRHSQAETKLRSILRDFPDQPGPLSQLFRVQCSQLDQHGAAATARKLADHLEVPVNDRHLFAAMALELEPDRKSLQSTSLTEYREVDSQERIEEALDNLDFVSANLDAPQHEQVLQYFADLVQDPVPAKRVYSLFDKPQTKPEDPNERVIASSIGNLAIYGKQTDKPTRVLLVATLLPATRDKIDQVLEALQLGDEVSGAEIPPHGYYADLLRRPKEIVGQPHAILTIEEQGQQFQEEFLNLPLALLDGNTPLEAAGDEQKRSALLSLLYHMEGEQSIVVEPGVIDEIYQRLDVVRPTVEIDGNSETIKLSSILDIDRLDIAKLSDRHLKGFLIRAMSVGATRVFYRCAMAVRQRAGLNEDLQLQLAALSGLLSILPDLDQRIEICRDLETKLVAAKSPVGKVIVQRMSLLIEAGRAEEAQQVLLAGAQKYPDDPYLISFMQHAMQAQGGRPGGGPNSDDIAAKMLQNAGQPAASADGAGADSGLVLPGQQSTSSGSGESKLWLPGS